jgi:TolB-like protein
VALLARIKGEERPGVAATAEPVTGTVFAQPSGGPPWIAVLPFRPLGPDPLADYLCHGLADDLVCNLAALREPVVVSSHSTRSFIDGHATSRQFARELGVRYIVSGSIRKLAGWLRISAELLMADSGMVVWARTFDARDGLWFEAQDQIVAQIISSLVRHIDDAELRRIRTKQPNDMTAYDLRLQAQDMLFRLDRDAFEQAGTMLRQAASTDPTYAPVHAMLSDWHSLRVGQGWSSDLAADTRALDVAAQNAIACDPHFARALASYGHNRSFLYRDYDTALRFFDEALQAAPNDAIVWKWTSTTYSYIGDGAEGARRATRALELSPRDPLAYGIYSSLCVAHYVSGEFDEAVNWGLRSFQANPRYTSNSRFLAASLVAIGRFEDARAIARSVLDIQPNFRVDALMKRHPLRNETERARLGQRLVQAGFEL